jgi:hypothetical protein
MPDTSHKFMDLALSKHVAIPALKVSIVVGTVLAFINHGDALLKVDLGAERVVQIALTFLVPYCVSTYSSVKAIQGHDRTHT